MSNKQAIKEAIMKYSTKDLKDGKHIIDHKGKRKVITVNNKPSMTDQSFKKDCDVNLILAKYRKTSAITHLAKVQGQFADVSDLPTMLESHERLQTAQDSFMDLPAYIRDKFDNDLMKMVDFLNDPKNAEEAIELGLRSRPISTDISQKVTKEEVKVDDKGDSKPS